jgi:hypothetical protein
VTGVRSADPLEVAVLVVDEPAEQPVSTRAVVAARARAVPAQRVLCFMSTSRCGVAGEWNVIAAGADA